MQYSVEHLNKHVLGREGDYEFSSTFLCMFSNMYNSEALIRNFIDEIRKDVIGDKKEKSVQKESKACQT